MRGKWNLRLSVWLAFLVLGAAAPLLIFSAATLFQISKDAQVSRDRGHTDTARALGLAVDAEIRSWKAALTALAESKSLQQGRLADFYEEARQVASQHEGWIVLIDSTGQQLLNTLRPYGAPLPKTGSPDVIHAIFRDGKPIVTDLAFGSVVQRLAVSAVVPVRRSGQIVYALSMTFAPERLTHLLQKQQLPGTWVAGLVDRQSRVIARSVDAAGRLGKVAPQALVEASARANSGLITYAMVDGRHAQVAFQRLSEVPWLLTMAVPLSEMPSPTFFIAFLGMAALLGAVAISMATIVARKIGRPISRLAYLAPALVQGEETKVGVASPIREVRELQQALVDACRTAQTASRERERAVVAVETARLATAAEQALRESEGRLHLFIQNAPAAIAMLDRDLRYLAVSRRWLTDYNLGDRDLVDQPLYEVFPEIPERWKAAHARGLAGEVIQSTEERFERMDGTIQWLRWEVRPWHKGDGAVGGIILFTEDITDRKQAEGEIGRLAKFPGENPSPIMRATPDGAILYANASSLPLLEVWQTGKGRLLPHSWRDAVQQVLAAGSTREIEAVCGDRVFSIQLVPFRTEGYVNLYGRDITERKRADRDLRQAHDELEQKVRERTAELSDTVERLRGEVAQRQQAEVHLQRTNQALRILSACNEALMRMDDEPELMQEICRIAVEIGGYRMAWVGLAQNDAEKSVRPVASTGFEAGYLETARITWADAERGRGPTGTAIRLGQVQIGTDFLTEPRLAPWPEEAIKRGFRSSIALPLRQGESVFGALTIYAAEPNAFQEAEVKILSELAEDLAYGTTALRMRTALRDSRDRLRALTGELMLAEQRERRRVAEVLHGGLQQLLVGAKLLVSPLGQAADPTVREACQEATDLILQAIQASRSLTEELSPPILSHGDLVSPLGWLARWMGEKFNLSVIVRVNETVVAENQDTATLVFQAIRELLFNTAKHAHVDTASVEIEPDGDQVKIVVSDAGAGFDPERLRLMGGTAGGYGLFSIRERLELLGGRMEIESTPGKGSRFTLWVPGPRVRATDLPAATSAEGSERSPQTIGPPAGVSSDSRALRKIRVLLVDDHRVMRQGLARLLQQEPDIEIVGEAPDGPTAVALTRQLQPDVVSMDIDLPGMNGIEVTRLIRAEFPRVQVIGLSMFEEAEHIAAMGEAGAATYIAKSGPPEALLAAIRACAKPNF